MASVASERENKIESEARRIALEHDLDPDDARLGHPAWRILWILERATQIVDAATDGQEVKEP